MTKGRATLPWRTVAGQKPFSSPWVGLDYARDDKGEGDASMENGCWTEAIFIPLGGPQAH